MKCEELNTCDEREVLRARERRKRASKRLSKDKGRWGDLCAELEPSLPTWGEHRMSDWGTVERRSMLITTKARPRLLLLPSSRSLALDAHLAHLSTNGYSNGSNCSIMSRDSSKSCSSPPARVAPDCASFDTLSPAGLAKVRRGGQVAAHEVLSSNSRCAPTSARCGPVQLGETESFGV